MFSRLTGKLKVRFHEAAMIFPACTCVLAALMMDKWWLSQGCSAC